MANTPNIGDRIRANIDVSRARHQEIRVRYGTVVHVSGPWVLFRREDADGADTDHQVLVALASEAEVI